MASSRNRTVLAVAIAILMVASLASASNMGFKKSFNVAFSGAGNNALSLPYLYTPTDVNANGLDSEDVCRDMNNGAYSSLSSPVGAVKRYNAATDTMTGHNCATPAVNNFSILAGTGYMIANAGGRTINSVVVGAHDNAKTVTFAFTGAGNNLWSMPYHIKLTDVNANGLDSEDLCRSVNGGAYSSLSSPLGAVKRYNTATDTMTGHNCATPAVNNFSLLVGNAYMLANAGGRTITYTPPHY